MWNSSKKTSIFARRAIHKTITHLYPPHKNRVIWYPLMNALQKFDGKKYFSTQMNSVDLNKKIYVTRKNKFNRTTEKCTFSSIPSHKINGKIDRIRNGYNIFEKKAQHINRNRSESDPKNQMCAIHTRRDLNWIESRYTIQWRPNKLRTSNLIVRANALLLHRWINPWFHQRHGEAYTRSYTHRWCLPIHRNVPFSAVIVYTHLSL